ncbi:haloacid dehalogenase-like hydrolase family member protein [Theileria equi strain WA]|uniref:Haloacid dehalogenase-like hydrolase family member protein n=1 Tax=Theileria equi strain WA TaxID=1537102 RepID=L0B085_THEEQ|nr:haloacid dehalogenase-like hydrolase family member protein [Theileria equi strain WA]AFZ80888.1 haloacid dehalogenase-like hydrolase family member protein [Theileria equi strain WA]|eukprot:XP_004830554.1 haloacid dehalogenase-like hydrolase family member protein [Theileria equi strain WA]
MSGNFGEGVDPRGDSSVLSNLSQFVKPENPPKYFGIDFDDTFFSPHDKEAFKLNLEAFAEARKKGFVPFFCTGKSLSSAMDIVGDDFIAKTGYNGYPGVYENGAMVYDENGKVVYSKPFSKEFVKGLAEFVMGKPSLRSIDCFVGDKYYSTGVTELMLKSLKERDLPAPQVVPIEDILRLDVGKIYMTSDHVDIPGFEQGKDYVAKFDLPGAWDVIPGGVSKAVGITKLMEHYGIPPKDCGFIGNGDNDTEAMDFCNLSFAVGNSPDFVKRHAKWVMDKTCDEGAVSEALQLTYDL